MRLGNENPSIWKNLLVHSRECSRTIVVQNFANTKIQDNQVRTFGRLVRIEYNWCWKIEALCNPIEPLKPQGSLWSGDRELQRALWEDGWANCEILSLRNVYILVFHAMVVPTRQIDTLCFIAGNRNGNHLHYVCNWLFWIHINCHLLQLLNWWRFKSLQAV